MLDLVLFGICAKTSALVPSRAKPWHEAAIGNAIGRDNFC